VATTASAIGLGGSSSYSLKDLWSKSSRTTTGAISASVPSHGTVVYRVARGTPGVAVEAEASGNTLSGSAARSSCATCSGGSKVRYVGNSASNWLTVNGVTVPAAGSYRLTVYGMVSGTRTFFVSVNGGAAAQVAMTGTDWSTPVTGTLTVSLSAGANSIRFFNDGAWAPDLDQITVG
jgi:hypothetical protein